MGSEFVAWLPHIALGTLYTVIIAVSVIILGTITGFIVGLLRFVPSAVASRAIGWVVEVIRAIPLLLLLFFIFFALPVIGIEIPTIPSAVLGFSLWMMSNTSEVVRGAIQSIPLGQTEAGRASGLSRLQIMRYITVPQAIQRMVPSYIGLCIKLTKDTSLAVIIGAFELTRATQEQLHPHIWY